MSAMARLATICGDAITSPVIGDVAVSLLRSCSSSRQRSYVCPSETGDRLLEGLEGEGQ